jgi:RecA-family ATPase
MKPDLEKLLAGDLRGPHPKEDFSLLQEPVRIRSFADIPDIATMNVTPAEPVIDGLLYSGSMTLLAGADGVAKTYLAQKAALAVAAGGEFLGRRCRQTPTL